MSSVIIGLLLASALIHAIWNAIVKKSQDRYWSLAVICLAGGIAALPFAIVLQLPTVVSWPYILLSSLLQIGYCLFLVKSYQHSDLSSVYPIIRGSAPLLVTLGAIIFAGELPNIYGLIGIILTSLGIIALSLGSYRPNLQATLAALISGIFIAGYMVVDGLGVRISGNAMGYAAWQAVMAGFFIPISYVIINRRALSFPKGKEGLIISGAGVLATLGYCIAVWAMSMNAMGGVSALRETSILFAAFIGIFILNEKMTMQKIIGALMVTIGVVSISI